jgi:Glycosyl transferases group 1
VSGVIARSTNAGYAVARRSLGMAKDALWDLRFPLPTLQTTAIQRSAPTVYFCAPDYDLPSGGMRVSYRHVDILNEAGIKAAVLHHRAGFRCTWFENDTAVVGSRDTLIGPGDLVVVSEVAMSLVRNLGPHHRFAVFNQNPHLMWERDPVQEVLRNTTRPGLVAVFVVSDHSSELVRYATPWANVVRLHNSIDPRRFFPGPAHERKVLSYMPRRGAHQAQQVLGILRAREALNGWEIRALDGLSEDQVAEQLRTTTIFLSLAHSEGFGLPAAEAMACGAYAVGFHGFAGREYFRPDFSSPVEPGDVLALAHAAADVIERETCEPGWCRTRGLAAAEFIATEYSPQRERHDVVQAYAPLLAAQAH